MEYYFIALYNNYSGMYVCTTSTAAIICRESRILEMGLLLPQGKTMTGAIIVWL